MKVLVITPEAGSRSLLSSLAESVNGAVKAYIDLGTEVRVYSPCFHIDGPNPLAGLEQIYAGQERVRGESYSIFVETKVPAFHYVQHSGYFDRSGHYSDPDLVPYWDNHYRFSLLVSAALQHAAASGFVPDYIHAHEWGAGFTGAYCRGAYIDQYADIPIVFTIHNLEYDFHFLDQDIERVGLDRRDFGMDGYEFWGKVSMLKVGILYADRVAFSSEGYRRQLLGRDLAGGIRGFLEYHQDRLIGIQHGIDYSYWSPFQGDKALEQKAAAKLALQQELGLSQDNALLVYCQLDKDTQRTAETLFTILSDLFHLRLQLVIGLSFHSMEREYLLAIARQNTGRMALMDLDHTNEVEKKALAGADLLFLSISEEPSCSLILKALANGVIPVAGEDVGCGELLTSFDGQNLNTANAFLVPDPWPDQMLRSLRLGLDLYEGEPANWKKLVRNAISFQHSWKKTASAYLAMKF